MTEAEAHQHDPTSPWDRHDIEPSEVIGVITFDGGSPEFAEYWCEGVPVARVSPDGVQLACWNPKHGSHPRYAKLVEAMTAALERLGAKPTECQDCVDGWLPVGHQQAARQVLVARVVGMFRGISLPRGE